MTLRKKRLVLAMLLAIAVLVGTGAENALAHGPKRPPIRTPFKPERIRGNWKEQWGGWTWSAVYRKDGWLEESKTGDNHLDVECDIELSCAASFSNNNVQFHIGNVSNLAPAERTAYVDGTITSNNGMYVGLSFAGTDKTATDVVTDASGNYTGEIRNAMVNATDGPGRESSGDEFNVKLLLSSDGGGTWTRPVKYGPGASGTSANTLWWSVGEGAAGTHDVKWSIELLPGSEQADGNYKFDPAVVMAPVL